MLKHSKHVDVLDTTLRDGSYTIGYQFTADETAIIAQGLELAGVDYIEVGHGLGLGADRAGKGAQAVTDLVYMRACANSIVNAKFGFFFIPGIGNMADLKLLADEGGKFVRVGIALESVDEACRAISIAKEQGLEVWANIMKTYAYPVKECKEWALRFIQAGADGVYIVDSAGGMLPTEVAEYASAIKEAFISVSSNARVGFHGHDNLSLSTACSLSAIQAGCDIVDGSLLGIGRSIGNAATEVLAMVLARAGYKTGINPWSAADLAEKMIRPFLEERWRHSIIDQALGYAQIHSGFLPILEKVSIQKNVSIRDIVLALDESARQNITEADVVVAAEYVISNVCKGNLEKGSPNLYIQNRPIENEFYNSQEPDLAKYTTEIKSQSLRMAKPAGIVVTGPWQKYDHNEIKLQQIRFLPHAVVGAIEIGNPTDLERVILAIDGTVDILFLDKTPRMADWNEMIDKLKSRVWQSRMMPYADEIASLLGACHIVAVKSNKKASEAVAVMGNDSRGLLLKFLLPYWGLRIVEHSHATIVVIADKIDVYELNFHAGVKLVYDLMSGSINAKVAQYLLDKGIEVIRLDGRPALASEVVSIIDAQNLTENIMGRGQVNNVTVIAGGFWGRVGDVVVNSIKNPTQVIGIADGKGGIKNQLNSSDVNALNVVKDSLRLALLNSITGRSVFDVAD